MLKFNMTPLNLVNKNKPIKRPAIKKITKQQLLNSLNEEENIPLIFHIDSILASKDAKYRLLLFLAGLLLLFLLIGDILFIIK